MRGEGAGNVCVLRGREMTVREPEECFGPQCADLQKTSVEVFRGF